MIYLSSLRKLQEELGNLFAIRTPLIWIRTQEQIMAEKAVLNICARQNIVSYFYYISTNRGARLDPITGKNAVTQKNDNLDDMFENQGKFSYPNELSNLSDAMKMLEAAPENTLLIIRNDDDLFRNLSSQQDVLDVCYYRMHKEGVYCPVVVITPEEQIPVLLRQKAVMIQLPLMGRKEHFEVIRTWLSRNKQVRITKTCAIEAASAAVGLTSDQFAFALKDSLQRTGTLTPDIIQQMKIQSIQESGVLHYIQPKRTLESVGGHNQFKRWIRETKAGMTAEARKYGVKPAKGYLSLGFPGTGKTLMAEAVANYLGVPLIVFDLSKMMGGLVGQSEHAVQKAFDIIRIMGPSVILLDEADKALAGAGKKAAISDGGTILRVFDIILQNLQKNTGQFYILTTNDIEKLPAPLTRAGRLDTKWFFSFPTKQERKDIFSLYFHQAGKEIPDEILDYAAKETPHFTGSEIETVVNNSIRYSFIYQKRLDKEETILKGIQDVTTSYDTSREEMKELMAYALKNHIPFTSSQGEDNDVRTE